MISDDEKKRILELYPEYSKVHGPYIRASDHRKIVVLCSDGSRTCTTRQLAKVRLESQLGRRLIGTETVDHDDEDSTNDHPDNLKLLLRDENSRKSAIGNKHVLGRSVPVEQRKNGQNASGAKLTDQHVASIRRRYSTGEMDKMDILRETGLSERAVRNLLYGDSYTYVEGAVERPRPGRPKK